MLKVMWKFNKNVLNMPQPWPLWMLLLVALNLVPPLFFLGTPEAKVVLVGMIVSATLMLTLFARFGYVRLLGIGHAPWLFTIPWLCSRFDEAAMSGLFYYWLFAVVFFDSISLVIDTVDVARYWRGERQTTVNVDV